MKLKLLDTLMFLPSSLGNLDAITAVDNLKVLKKLYSNSSLFHLLRRKSVYPNERTDDETNFNALQLSIRGTFHSKLIDEDISDNKKNFQKVWNKLKCKNL